MYQQNIFFDLKHLGNDPEDQFNKLVTTTLDSIKLNPEMVESDPKEYDMSCAYTPNWACIWNKPSDVGRMCRIVQKNDKFAIVMFMLETELSLRNFYRLEDITAV